jgi:ubiquinone/menaquinone biosynthesis C-methylase UbiE
MVSFYREKILPYLVHKSMRQETLAPYRHRVISAATGRVLELGIGSGLNLSHYGDAAEHVLGIDPSPKLLSMAQQAVKRPGLPVTFLKASAEDIPLDDDSVDTVVSTWTLCTIPDVHRALAEMRRVLKPDGRLRFVEHGLSSDGNVRRWQNRLTPLWRCIGGGCHLNRDITQLVEGAGFRIEKVHMDYMKGPKPMTFMYEGIAR